MNISKEDSLFLISLLPEWAIKEIKGASPMFYGTGSQKGDKTIIDRVNKIFYGK